MLSCLTCRATRKSLQNHGLAHLTHRTGFTTSVSRNLLSPRQEVLTIVHKALKIIPPTLSLNAGSDSTRSVESWGRILSRIYQDLDTEHSRPINIVVCPLDEWSASKDLVTALLTDPFSSDGNRSLIDRWKSCTQEQLRITYEPQSKSIDPAHIALPSAYLTQFSAPIEFIELCRPISISQTFQHDTVVGADISILVCNPLVTSLSSVAATHLPSNSILVLSSGIPQHELDQILEHEQSHAQSPNKPSQFVAVEPRRAANAVQILQKEPNSVVAIQRYQDDVLGSQISQVTDALQSKLSTPVHSAPQTELAVHRFKDALNSCHSYLRSTKSGLDVAFLDSCALRDHIEESVARAENDIFEKSEGSGKKARNKVMAALEWAQKDLIQTMDFLTWWRLLWKVDDISPIVTAALQTWCHDLEKELILKTGKLSTLQRKTAGSAFELLSKHPVIQTALLQNRILQLEASPTYQLSSESLTKPIYLRRNQIIKYPTTRLHIAGQKAILGMGGGITAGVGVGWAGWLGWLLGSGDGIFGFLCMEPGTAMGVGMLVAVASIRWGVGSWENAKKRWWQDWRRVGEGLERDLKDTLDRTMRQQVTVVARTACDGFRDLVSKREHDIADASKQLDELQNSLDRINAKLRPNQAS